MKIEKLTEAMKLNIWKEASLISPCPFLIWNISLLFRFWSLWHHCVFCWFDFHCGWWCCLLGWFWLGFFFFLFLFLHKMPLVSWYSKQLPQFFFRCRTCYYYGFLGCFAVKTPEFDFFLGASETNLYTTQAANSASF